MGASPAMATTTQQLQHRKNNWQQCVDMDMYVYDIYIYIYIYICVTYIYIYTYESKHKYIWGSPLQMISGQSP